MAGYVEGYRKAAEAVFENAASAGTSPDYVIFPLAFLWRQHVELALKDIIARGRRLDGEDWSFPLGHGLLKLWAEARPHIAKCGEQNAPELAHVEANMREFEQVDPGADGFRYPFNRRLRERTLENAPDHVNLEALHEAMDALANFFDAVRSEMQMRQDYVDEMMAEEARLNRDQYE